MEVTRIWRPNKGKHFSELKMNISTTPAFKNTITQTDQSVNPSVDVASIGFETLRDEYPIKYASASLMPTQF